MGKTQRLVDMLISCLHEGQPKSVVIGASEEHASYLCHRVCQTLDARQEDYVLSRDGRKLWVDEAVVEFVGIHRLEHWCHGRHNYGQFWHDYAEWCYEKYVENSCQR